MAEYDIGGGKKIKVPDNLDPETRLQLAEVVKDKYGIDINQTSALEQAGEFVKAIPRGVASLALDVPTGIVGLFDIGNDSNLYKGLEGLQQRLREDSVLAADPRYADKFSTKLGEGIGSFGPFLGAGIVGRALSKAPGAAKGFLSPTFTAPTALAIPTGIAAQGDRLQMAREMGEDVGGLTETTAELFGGLIGITEVLPIANILGKVHKNAPLSTKEKLVSALQSGAAEGGQEVAASILQDLTARGLYSEDLPVADSMFEEFTIGGIIGAGADLVVSSMAGKKSIRNKQLEEDNLRVNENKQRLILAKKQEQAIEQGVLEEMQDMPPITVPQIIAPEEKPTEPSIEVVSTPQEKFAVVDISNPESPAQIDIKDTEIEAIKVRDKILKDFNFNILKSKLDNDVYNLGLINSKSAYEIGQSLEDSRASDVTIQQLINSVPKDSKQEVILRGLVNSFVAQNPGKTSRSYPRLSMTKAKQLLTPKQFNEFTSAYAQSVFKNSEKNGEPSIIADKDKPDTSAKYIKEIAASKNIDLDFQSPAVQYAAEKYTGTPEFKKMKQGQKELFLAKLHSLPKFNSRTTFPDFRPRNYTAQDMADFVANTKSNKVIFDKNSLLKVGPDSIRKNKLATEQFIDDLIYSGRAEQIEGTNNYKIKDNFEFDIARKAEGFNETPEEFSARLTAEGKLPPETIAELVEKETKNQEKLLPPAEIVPKTINYAETLQEGKVNKFTKELRKRLNAVGLKETGIVVSDDILSTSTLQRVEGKIKFDPRVTRATETAEAVEGEYDRNTDTIFLSLNAINPDGGATEVEIEERLRKVLDHEMIHAFRAKDLISEKEYQYLKKLVKDKKFPNDPEKRTFYKEAVDRTRNELANRNLSDAFKEDYIVEEAIAELFRNKDLLVNTPPKVDGIFNKIIQFFKTMGQAMRSSGYKSATEIFNNIESGRVGARERGVVRTTRLLDAGRIPASFINIDPDIPAEQQEIIPGDEIRQTLKPTGIRPVSIPKPGLTPTTPPAGPTTPPITPITSPVPNKIYNSKQMSAKERSDERTFILNGLRKAGVFNPRSRTKGDSVKMMKWLKNNAPNKDYKIIATKVHQSLVALEKAGYNFPLEITQDKSKTRGYRGRVSYLALRPTYFEMRINDVFGKDFAEFAEGKIGPTNPVARTLMNSNGVNFETLLHEGIHQATVPHMEDVSGGPKSKNKKIQKAYKDLASQRTRVETYVKDIMSKFDEGATNIESGNLTFDEFMSSLPTTLNNSLRVELRDVYFNNGNLRTKSDIRRNLRYFKENLIDYRINGIQSGKAKPDSSEFLTFGLTNRNFQELLESIPTKPGATKSIWNEFVEAIRNILGIPAKLDTELSAFLKNAGVVLDLQAEGVPLAGMDVGGRGVAEEVSLFSRPTKKYPTTQKEINTAPREILEESLNYHNQLLFEKQREQTVDSPILKDFEERSLNRVITNISAIINKTEQRLKELDNGIQPPLFSRTNLIPKDIEVPFDWASNNRFETGAILDQLIKSRISGTRDNPGPLKMTIVDAFKGKNNRPLLKASKKFLEKFTNKKGNLVLFRTLNIPEGEKIKNYGQLPEDLFASTTLDSRQALKIGRSLFNRAQSQGATWNPEILRYEVPMSKVKGYVPMLLKAMESDFITEFRSDMAGSGIMSQEELDAAIEEADAKGDFYKYQGEQTTEELLADAIFEYNGFIEEAEVLADLRGIKPTYQYSPATKDRQASLIDDVPLFSRSRRDSKRKFSDFYYHITPTPNVRSILQSSINPLKPSNFINARTGNRFQDEPAVFAFTNPIDAIQWWSNTTFNREDLSILLIDKNANNWTQDPASMSFKDNIKEDFRLVNSDVFGFGANEQPTSVITTQPVQAKDIKGSLTLPDLFGKLGEIYGTVSGIDNTTPYYGLLPTRIDGKEEQITYMNRVAEALNPMPNTQKNIQLKQAVEEAEEIVKQSPRGSIPYYNLNASDTALKAAIDFNKDLSAEKPDDIPNFSRPTLDNIDPKISEAAERLGGEHRPDMSWGARTIEAVQDPITSIGSAFKNFRQSLVDKLDKVDKALVKAIQENEDVRIANNTADTATMAALRLADRARGLFAGMLTRGYVTDVIDGQPALANVRDLELENGETGGLIQILAPLFSNSDVNLEQVFKLYATLKRAKTFDETGREIDTPVKPEDFVLIEQIEQQHPEVVEVYNNYQEWNNKLIEFATNKGLLDPEQAEIWRQHSSYYPFYKDMIDDTGLQGPNVAGGSLPNNPLNIKITGSEKPIDADPIEAIARNSLSILTGALKNDGVVKLVRDLEKVGEAKELKSPQEIKANTLNRIFVFEDGNKKFYKLKDPELFHAIQAIGGTNVGPIAQALAIPAGFLRDTVTRDPGFVVVNILRDTLSSSITSGASYTPFIDSVKNMFGDMENLEKFGVLGGYDFANDEGSVKQFITRTMRQKGLTPSNGMSASGAFFKLWDGLGALTTKSDGATRMAVYDAVYKKLKDEGYNEAQAQSEAAYQALEIINFGRRGLDPTFRIVTAAIPFLNARIQGLDVLYRGLFTGQYSAVEKLGANETLKDVQSRILKRALFRAGILSSITLAYYLMVHDTDEYKNLKREVRDDNWVVPIGNGNAVKIPIPFEVGMLFKAIPERVFDMTLGDEAFTRKSVDEALTSITRQLGTSANIPFFQPGAGFQILKPIAEVRANRNSFTNTEIVPYYQQKKEAGLQARATTNEFARIMGEFLNISPAKIEHIMRGYTGTLGGYLLALVDTVTRGATGSPLLPSNFELGKLPVINRLFLDLDKTGGYQQQFYELRNEVDKAVSTINSLQKQDRFDELSAYRSNMQGLLNIKGQVRSIERYLDNWRKRRDRLMRDENISVTVKSDMLRELELERDMRLAMVPELRKKANIPIFSLNL